MGAAESRPRDFSKQGAHVEESNMLADALAASKAAQDLAECDDLRAAILLSQSGIQQTKQSFYGKPFEAAVEVIDSDSDNEAMRTQQVATPAPKRARVKESALESAVAA